MGDCGPCPLVFLSCMWRADSGSYAWPVRTPLMSIFGVGMGKVGGHEISPEMVHSPETPSRYQRAQPFGNERFPLDSHKPMWD